MCRQSDKKITKQIRIDVKWHSYLALFAKLQGRSIGSLVEECLADYYDPDFYADAQEMRKRYGEEKSSKDKKGGD